MEKQTLDQRIENRNQEKGHNTEGMHDSVDCLNFSSYLILGKNGIEEKAASLTIGRDHQLILCRLFQILNGIFFVILYRDHDGFVIQVFLQIIQQRIQVDPAAVSDRSGIDKKPCSLPVFDRG